MTQLVIQGSQSVASKSAQRVRGKISFNARKATQGEIINRTARSVGGRGEALAETCWAGGRGALRLRTAAPRGQGGAQSGLGIRGSRCRQGQDPLFFSGLNTRGSETLSGAMMGSSGLEPAPPQRQESHSRASRGQARGTRMLSNRLQGAQQGRGTQGTGRSRDATPPRPRRLPQG